MNFYKINAYNPKKKYYFKSNIFNKSFLNIVKNINKHYTIKCNDFLPNQKSLNYSIADGIIFSFDLNELRNIKKLKENNIAFCFNLDTKMITLLKWQRDGWWAVVKEFNINELDAQLKEKINFEPVLSCN